jgi:NAD(P)-dependent dehydrogenase (short-subunit alcohol dehydrogenase family)
MYLTKCIVERMRRQGKPASIIFLTSIQQFNPSGWTSYSSSKAALGMIIKELAGELAAFRIRVNGIAPGPVKIEGDGSLRPHRLVPLYKTHIPPEFVGRAAVFLASDFYSYYTTGTVLTVDGGISLYNHHSEQLSHKRNKQPP